MANTLKHSILILFTGLLLFNTGGSLVFFKLREAAIEAEFKKALANNQVLGNVAVVKFTDAELQNAHWEDEHEIVLNGHYYDVLATEYKNGHTVYICFADDNETALYAWYNNYKKQQVKNGVDDDDFAGMYRNTFINKIHQVTYLTTYLQTINTHYSLLNTQVASVPKSPPPKV